MRNMPDPQQLLASAYRFAGVANGITASAGRLRSSTIQLNEVWTGQGGEAFERASATCLSDIDILPKVIQFTIMALNQYALRIEEAQSLYNQARELYAEAAASTGAEAANLYRQAVQKEREGDFVFDAADRAASNSFREIGMMTSQMKGKLHPVANLSTKKKPGFWEQVGNAFKDIGNEIGEAEQWIEGEEVKAGEWIGKEAEDIWKNRYTYMEDLSKVLEGVSAVSGILALAMVWFPPAAGVLETISLASAGAAAADDAILLASGHGSAETFVEDAVSTIPGGAAIGVGKAIKYAKETRVAEEAVEETGNLVRSELPKLTGTLAEAFDGPIETQTLEPKKIYYRSEAAGADYPGHWLGTEKPVTAAEADKLYNIAIWNNPMEQVGEYEVTGPVTVYYGKVAGGTGMQIYIPEDVNPTDVFRRIGTTLLEK